jgi:dephospho-CoA kinase
VFYAIPIIGIAGGIGSGKTFVADLFGELGCCVIHADDQIREAYSDLKIQQVLRQMWGDQVFRPDGSGVDRRAIAQRIFSDESDRRKLENLLHPWIAEQRDWIMANAAQSPAVQAFVWDTPLLFEADLAGQCDAIVYVDTPDALRYNRVQQTRGWEPAEIIRREKLQWPLDKKRKMAHYVIVNTADAADCRSHVREILSRILAK